MADVTLIPNRAPAERCAELLKEVAESARKGEVRSVAVVVVYAGGSVGTMWEREDGDQLHQLVSGVSYLQHRLCKSVIED